MYENNEKKKKETLKRARARARRRRSMSAGGAECLPALCMYGKSRVTYHVKRLPSYAPATYSADGDLKTVAMMMLVWSSAAGSSGEGWNKSATSSPSRVQERV